MARLLLDTSVLIDVLGGRPAAERLRRRRVLGITAFTTAVNVEEVYRGLGPAEEAAAEDLFEWLRVVPLEHAEGRRSGEVRRHLARRGVTLSQSDSLVAAAAATIGAAVVTGNPKDFVQQDVEVEFWPPGE